MRAFHWGMQAGFPHAKVFVLGIWLTLLGSACIVVSVIGIVHMAWGWYVSTGMWGGVVITMTGLATMYAARVQTSLSAKIYLVLSVLSIFISFAMLVLSAGGLTYKSNFYKPVRYDSYRHRVTLFLHGSVLSVSVLSLACNILSVIVCLKFISFEKNRRSNSLKLRKRRHRFSDPNGVSRSGSLQGGSSGGTARSSTSSRAPLVGSERSQRHSRQSSYSDSGSLRASGDRIAHRRDSDRSRGSSRSRPSHNRQSSSASQQSRYESLHSRQSSQHGGNDSVYSTLTLESRRSQHSASHGSASGGGAYFHPSHAARVTHEDSEHLVVQPVFDSDEEPVPPYEESTSNLRLSSNNGDESDVENSDHATLDDSSNTLCGISHLPLNIPVTEVGTVDSRQEPDNLLLGRTGAGYSGSHGGLRVHLHTDNSTHVTAEIPGASSRSHHNYSRSPRPSGAGGRSQNRGSPEICALTGERETPSTLRGSPSPDESASDFAPSTVHSSDTSRTLTDGGSSQVSHLNHSPDSSDTSLPDHDTSRGREGALLAGSRSSTLDSHAVVSLPGRRGADAADQFSGSSSPVFDPRNEGATSSRNAAAAAFSLGSPNSAFRPVGRTVPVSQISPSVQPPADRLFSPISAHNAAHGTCSNLESSTESLSRSSATSWKMIPLPSSHNHSNRASSVPTKELNTKTIPVPGFHSPRVYGRTTDPQSLLPGNACSVSGSARDASSSAVRSPGIRTHNVASAVCGSSNVMVDSSHYPSLLRDVPRLDRNSAQSDRVEQGQRTGGRQDGSAMHRHTVEVPSSIRSQPAAPGGSVNVTSSSVNITRGSVNVTGSSVNATGGSVNVTRPTTQRLERERHERRTDPASVSLRGSGHGVSAGPVVRRSSGGQSRALAQPSQPQPPSQQQQQQNRPLQRADQQQLHQSHHRLPPPAQQQQLQQPPPQQQPAQQQNRPLFSVLL